MCANQFDDKIALLFCWANRRKANNANANKIRICVIKSMHKITDTKLSRTQTHAHTYCDSYIQMTNCVYIFDRQVCRQTHAVPTAESLLHTQKKQKTESR